MAGPSASQVLNPHTFLTREGRTRGPLAKIARALNLLCSLWLFGKPGAGPTERKIDAVPLSALTPEEDEFATMMSGRSTLLAHVFPRDSLEFFAFDEREKPQWQQCWLLFLRKLSLYYDNRRIVLKSPAHMFRVSWILDVFPEAKFVFISRNPDQIYPSLRNTTSFLRSLWSFQAAQPPIPNEHTIAGMRAMVDTYRRDRALIPPENLHELSYESLSCDPLATIADIYSKLGLPNFATARPYILGEIVARQDYKANVFPSISQQEKDLLRQELVDYYEAYGYPG